MAETPDAILVSATNFFFGITLSNGAVVGRVGSGTAVSDSGEVVSDSSPSSHLVFT